jgi:hypothetical protein
MSEKIKQLYASEINGSITWFYDGLVTAKLGDEMNGYKDEKTFDTVDEAIEWLWETAKKHYPKCELWYPKEQENAG